MIHSLFPVAVYMNNDSSLLEDSNRLFEIAGDKYIVASSGTKTTLLGGYSPGKANLTFDPKDHEEGKRLEKFLEQQVANFIREKRLKEHHIEICNIWLNENGQNSCAELHKHYGYSFSGVYYIACPKNTGEIFFGNPEEDIFYQRFYGGVEETTMENSNQWYFSVTEGDIIIFPSYLKHAVPRIRENVIRKSIAFDCNIRQKL
jgi:uncharacterized protein (TIGR02466 family)